jgi:hypothetical protein
MVKAFKPMFLAIAHPLGVNALKLEIFARVFLAVTPLLREFVCMLPVNTPLPDIFAPALITLAPMLKAIELMSEVIARNLPLNAPMAGAYALDSIIFTLAGNKYAVKVLP